MAQRITPEKVNRPEQFQRFPDSSVMRAASGNISGEVLHCPPVGSSYATPVVTEGDDRSGLCLWIIAEAASRREAVIGGF